jgi:protocatechuate 3,4-dioxygenase beta subunit
MGAIFLVLMFLFLQTPQPTASLEGIVINVATNEPIPRAVVLASTGTAQNTKSYSTVTNNSDGRFVLRGISPGTYTVTVARAGYASPPAKSIVLTSGQEMKDLVVRMTQFGVISGRVLDRDGDAIPEAIVFASKASYANGQRSLTTVKRVLANDLGEYRLFGLLPGRYFVNASGSGTMMTGEIYSPMFYPGTVESSAASSIVVRSGGDSSGIDFALPFQRPSRIRGRVIDAVTGLSPKGGNVALRPRGGGTLVRNNGNQLQSFDFTGLTPGSYLLSAEVNGGGTVAMPIDLGSRDIDNLVISVPPPVKIHGRFAIEGRSSNRDLDTLHVQVLLRGVVGTDLRSAFVTPEGAITISNLPVGDSYRLEISGMPSTWYIKIARFGDVDALNAAIRLEDAANSELQILASPSSATLDCMVTDDRQRPSSGVTVVLVPDAGRRQRSDLYRSAKTDTSGRVHLEGIAPGDYKVFAWDEIETGSWQDPEIIQLYEARGEFVHIEESSKADLTLKSIPPVRF